MAVVVAGPMYAALVSAQAPIARHQDVQGANAGGWLHVAGGPHDPGRLGQASSGSRP